MISKSWKDVCLSEVCEINPGKRTLLDKDKEMEVSFLPMAAVSEEGKILSQERRKLKDVIKGYTNFQNGDVLLAKITPCFENGKRAIARDLTNGIGFGSTEFHVLRPSCEVTSDWIFYAISRSDFCNVAKSQMTGTAGQKRVPSRVLEQFRIPIPSVLEQEGIVGNIETQFTRLEVAIKSLTMVKAKLDLYRKSVLKAAFAGVLTNCPVTDTIRMGDVATLRAGTGFPKMYQNKRGLDYGFYKVGDISRAWLKKSINLIEPEHEISKATLEQIKGKLIPTGSVVFAKIGEALKLNRRAVTQSNCLVDNNVFALTPLMGSLDLRFLFYFMLTIDLAKNSRATTVPSLRKEDVEGIKMPAFSYKEQKRIVEQIELRFSVINKVIEIIDRSLLRAEQLRKSILKTAFEGNLTN